MIHGHPLPRLAAKQGIRQIEAHIKADAAAEAVDRKIRQAWQQVLKFLREPRGLSDVYTAARKNLSNLGDVVDAALADSLHAVVRWGHKSAAKALQQELPAWVGKVVNDEKNTVLSHMEGRMGVSRLDRGRMDVSTNKESQGFVVRNAHESLPPTKQLTERVDPEFTSLLFPAPSQYEADSIVYATGWRERLKSGTRLGSPDTLAALIAGGVASGKNHREIAKDILPHVENVRSSARRIARTESLRVASATQMRCHDQLGDLVIGYQIHATLDQHTRPEHAARSGTIYYKEPRPGQLGYDDMPNPPHEADGSVAWNCRCYLTPVLTPLEAIKNDPAFLRPDELVPDPIVYSEWFERTDQRRRRLAVGSRRYSLVYDLRGNEPGWEDFIDPESGNLLSQSSLAAETHIQRQERIAKVRAMLAERKRLAMLASAFGFVPDTQ